MIYTFKIPHRIPPSYNLAHRVIYSQRRQYLSRDAREFQYLVAMSMPAWKVDKDDLFRMKITIACNWFYKNGRVRKKDIQNMDKLLVDAVFKKLGIDDSHLFELIMVKFQSLKEVWTKVKIKKV